MLIVIKNDNKIPNTSKNTKLLTVRQVKRSLITQRIVKKVMRRSVTIEKDLHDFILEFRGWLGMEKHLDADYTTVLNALGKLGAIRMNEWENLTENEKEAVLETLLSEPEKQIESAADEWWTKRLKVELPEYSSESTEEESQEGAEGTQELVSQEPE